MLLKTRQKFKGFNQLTWKTFWLHKVCNSKLHKVAYVESIKSSLKHLLVLPILTSPNVYKSKSLNKDGQMQEGQQPKAKIKASLLRIWPPVFLADPLISSSRCVSESDPSSVVSPWGKRIGKLGINKELWCLGTKTYQRVIIEDFLKPPACTTWVRSTFSSN